MLWYRKVKKEEKHYQHLKRKMKICITWKPLSEMVVLGQALESSFSYRLCCGLPTTSAMGCIISGSFVLNIWHEQFTIIQQSPRSITNWQSKPRTIPSSNPRHGATCTVVRYVNVSYMGPYVHTTNYLLRLIACFATCHTKMIQCYKLLYGEHNLLYKLSWSQLYPDTVTT